MTSKRSTSIAIAEWLAGLRPDEIPDHALQSAKLRVLDIVGAMLGGRGTLLVNQVLGSVTDSGGAVPVVGFDKRVELSRAALLQGTMACVLEYDDTHVASGIHSSSAVIAAALGVGRQFHISGSRLLEAVLIGNELAARLALVAPGMMHRVGIHPTAIFATFGSGYAIAKILGFDARQIINTAGICGSFASGIMASWEDGTAAKSLHTGWAASSAVQAANLARQGVTGPSNVFEGRFGLFRSHVQVPEYEFDLGAARDKLGQRWEALNIAPRAYPCGHYIQPFIEAVLGIVQSNSIEIDQIERIDCAVAEYMVPLICEPAKEKLNPATSWHARYSLPFCIAACLQNGTFNKYSLSDADLADDSHRKLAAKVTYQVDRQAVDRTKWGGGVTIVYRSGERFGRVVEHLRGTPQNPMQECELVAKFMHNAEGVLNRGDSERAVNAIMQLERVEDIDPVFDLLSVPIVK
ncbi:MAG: MmgE/PrpD family protein [Rhizobiaceae bacterium]|nr:MmgE/PrpD family protein [Rhizobiaceae bacterium]